jgi:hypothetical protein
MFIVGSACCGFHRLGFLEVICPYMMRIRPITASFRHFVLENSKSVR